MLEFAGDVEVSADEAEGYNDEESPLVGNAEGNGVVLGGSWAEACVILRVSGSRGELRY